MSNTVLINIGWYEYDGVDAFSTVNRLAVPWDDRKDTAAFWQETVAHAESTFNQGLSIINDSLFHIHVVEFE